MFQDLVTGTAHGIVLLALFLGYVLSVLSRTQRGETLKGKTFGPANIFGRILYQILYPSHMNLKNIRGPPVELDQRMRLLAVFMESYISTAYETPFLDNQVISSGGFF